ncbi:hypothetical protein [Oceanimonas baumannii]|uniref:DNA polymerase III subunit psi n=1 Tax=Oceanimonas baumannii TaxID=129578 RepID=A0A235CG89_9GAMM|nr:hypothetical protein [Oceanimonas baumannii]OYD22855.1 hypothetical protein B6S09_14035 [Oceanimonas baumannii]TDW56328.1 hypothetical protein LY04_03131 [Oceanimonas baumannii]
MKPLQSRLWQFLDLPVWKCTHAERLPYAPVPDPILAGARLIIGRGCQLPNSLLRDLVIALAGVQPEIQDENAWLAAGRPGARIILGFNLTSSADGFSWQGTLPLSSSQKRELWHRLCDLNSEH